TGTTTIAEGTLVLGAANALPTFGNNIPNGTNLVLGQGVTSGTLDMNGFSQEVDRLSSSGTGTNNHIVNNVAGPVAVLKVSSISANTTYNGTVDGNINIYMNGLGSLTLTNTASTYTGGVVIDNGG